MKYDMKCGFLFHWGRLFVISAFRSRRVQRESQRWGVSAGGPRCRAHVHPSASFTRWGQRWFTLWFLYKNPSMFCKKQLFMYIKHQNIGFSSPRHFSPSFCNTQFITPNHTSPKQNVITVSRWRIALYNLFIVMPVPFCPSIGPAAPWRANLFRQQGGGANSQGSNLLDH